MMKYNTDSTVKVRLHSGQIVEANITSIVSRSTGRKIHIAYGNATGVVNPAQIIEVTEAASTNEMPKLTTSQIVYEIAEDYLHLAAGTDGKADALRERNYRWLIKLADKIKSKGPFRPSLTR
jgi:hypothetical protein